MKPFIALSLTVLMSGCALFMTPEQAAQEAASDRFETCMNSTLGSFGPFRYGTQEARLKAAEICRTEATATEKN